MKDSLQPAYERRSTWKIIIFQTRTQSRFWTIKTGMCDLGPPTQTWQRDKKKRETTRELTLNILFLLFITAFMFDYYDRTKCNTYKINKKHNSIAFSYTLPLQTFLYPECDNITVLLHPRPIIKRNEIPGRVSINFLS